MASNEGRPSDGNLNVDELLSDLLEGLSLEEQEILQGLFAGEIQQDAVVWNRVSESLNQLGYHDTRARNALAQQIRHRFNLQHLNDAQFWARFDQLFAEAHQAQVAAEMDRVREERERLARERLGPRAKRNRKKGMKYKMTGKPRKPRRKSAPEARKSQKAKDSIFSRRSYASTGTLLLPRPEQKEDEEEDEGEEDEIEEPFPDDPCGGPGRHPGGGGGDPPADGMGGGGGIAV